MTIDILTHEKITGRTLTLCAGNLINQLRAGRVLHSKFDGAMFVFGIDADDVRGMAAEFAVRQLGGVSELPVYLVPLDTEQLDDMALKIAEHRATWLANLSGNMADISKAAVRDDRPQLEFIAPIHTADGSPIAHMKITNARSVRNGQDQQVPLTLHPRLAEALSPGTRFYPENFPQLADMQEATATVTTGRDYPLGRIVYVGFTRPQASEKPAANI